MAHKKKSGQKHRHDRTGKPSGALDSASTLPKSVILKAGAPVYGGRTIGRITQESTEGAERPRTKVVLIQGAIPGETVEVLVEEERKDYYLASVKKVIELSPHRIEPGIQRASCIGCHLQYISYDRQVSIKEEVLSDALRRIGNIETGLSDPLILKDNIWNYRYRGQFKVSEDKIGFYKEKTREIVDIDNSPLMVDEINGVLKKLHEVIHGHPGRLKGVSELHVSYGGGVFALVKTDVKGTKAAPPWEDLASLLLSCGFEGLAIENGTRKILKYGKEFLTLPLDSVTYTVSPMSFFQSNWKLNQSMVKFIKDHLQPLQGKRVLDLFSGAGNFSLPIARDASEVTAVEENSSAIEDGKRNLQINNINNLQFFRSPAEDFDISAYSPDVVIADPPRAGFSSKLIENLLKACPERIVYISCNPSTLARDLKKLTGKYRIESIRLVDLFPQTYHIETLAFLRLSQK